MAEQTTERPAEMWKAGEFVTFPRLLYGLLVRDDLADCLHWSDDGTAVIFHLKHLSAKLLDPHFQGTKLTSFTRKLNRWGFRKNQSRDSDKEKTSTGGGCLCYSHPLFRRNKPELVSQMSSTNKPHHSAEAIRKYEAAPIAAGNIKTVSPGAPPTGIAGFPKVPESIASMCQAPIHRAMPQPETVPLSSLLQSIPLVSGHTMAGMANLQPCDTFFPMNPLFLEQHLLAHRSAVVSALQAPLSPPIMTEDLQAAQLLRNLQLVRDFERLQHSGITTSTTMAIPMPNVDMSPSQMSSAETMALFRSLFAMP